MIFFICLLVLLPLQAFGNNLIIPTEPLREEIDRIKRYRVIYGFRESSSGEFQVYVKMRYRSPSSRIKQSKHFSLSLLRGAIEQRDPKTLILRVDNRELVVGQHRWWYSPYWQVAKGVRITCDHHQLLHRVVVENCRLRIKTS